jgi:hypothetical protein
MHTWTLGVGITCMILMTLAVAVRTYTKALIMRDMKHEDCTQFSIRLGFDYYSHS